LTLLQAFSPVNEIERIENGKEIILRRTPKTLPGIEKTIPIGG
jgi:hypothetical protein